MIIFMMNTHCFCFLLNVDDFCSTSCCSPLPLLTARWILNLRGRCFSPLWVLTDGLRQSAAFYLLVCYMWDRNWTDSSIYTKTFIIGWLPVPERERCCWREGALFIISLFCCLVLQLLNPILNKYYALWWFSFHVSDDAATSSEVVTEAYRAAVMSASWPASNKVPVLYKSCWASNRRQWAVTPVQGKVEKPQYK